MGSGELEPPAPKKARGLGIGKWRTKGGTTGPAQKVQGYINKKGQPAAAEGGECMMLREKAKGGEGPKEPARVGTKNGKTGGCGVELKT